MNFKLVAVSMSVLGLISSPVLADSMHKHKHKRHHHHVAHHDYKAMGALPMQSAPVVEVPAPVASSALTSTILDQMTQNNGMARPMPEWFNRIGLSGGVNFDTLKWGNRSAKSTTFPSGAGNEGYSGENMRRFSLNPVYINVSADVSEWSKAFASITFIQASNNYSAAYQTSAVTGDLNNRLQLEQGFLRIANFDCSPVFFEAGKQFQDFGRYELHPITRSMTQVMSEALHTSVKLGFITDVGFNGSIAMFQDPIARAFSNEGSVNYVASLGFANPNDQWGYDLGVNYMYNIWAVNDIGNSSRTGGASAATAATTVPAVALPFYYHSRVGGVSAYADVNFDAFTLGARYVTATSHFSNADIVRDSANPTTGARPWTAGLQAGYDFAAWNRTQNLYVGFQASHDGVNLNLPRQRWQVGYSTDVYKNASITAEYDHDVSYGLAKGGATAGNTNLLSLRAAVKFG